MKWILFSIVPLAAVVANDVRGQEWEEAPADPAQHAEEAAESAEPPDPPAPKPRAAPAAKTAEAPGQTSQVSHHHHHHPRWHSDGSFSVSIGKATLQADALDERLTAHGYEPISDRALQVGLLGMKVFDGGLVLGLGASFTANRASGGPNDSEVHARIGHVYGLLGGAAVKSRRWLVAPSVLLGGYRMILDIDASDSASLDAVLDDPERGVELSQSGWFVGAMIVIDRRIQWRRDSSRFTSLGLRVGVLEAVSAHGWRFGDDHAGDGPEVLPRVGFVAVALGFGHYR